MQDPNADTQWNDILRQKGIIPAKKDATITESDVVDIVEKTVQNRIATIGKEEKEKEDMTLDELDELEDLEDERVLLEYRKKRLAEIAEISLKSKYGDVREISAEDYVEHVNKAGHDVWVVLHLYKSGIPLCSLINQYLVQLASKFPAVKFLRSISTTCIPNFPDANLPALFVYFEGEVKKQLIGPHTFRGTNLKLSELEWMLSEIGVLKTDLEENPRPKTKDILFSSLQGDDDGNDW